MGINTPWGVSDSSHKQAPGLFWYSTPSHGGLRVVDPELLAKIPPYLMPRKDDPAWYRQICANGWFEEDCEWARVALAFPDLFDATDRARAEETMRHTFPETWLAYWEATRSARGNVVACFDCGKILAENVDTLSEAQRLAAMHTRATPHLRAFGYPPDKRPDLVLAYPSGVMVKRSATP